MLSDSQIARNVTLVILPPPPCPTAVPPGRMISRPIMVSKSTQTKPDRKETERDILATTMGDYKLGMDCEDPRTVYRELIAEISNHMVLAKNSCMEPMFTLRGLSAVGVHRFFLRWPEEIMQDGATQWMVSSPMQLKLLLRLEQWHKMGWGPCKLHVRGKEVVGRKLLMAQPPFRGWFRRCPRGRTQLMIDFKLLVFDEGGHVTPPPNCAYSDEAIAETREMAIHMLSQMAERGMPLSPALCRLAGNEKQARCAQARLLEWECQRKLARKTARNLETDLDEDASQHLSELASSELPSPSESPIVRR